MFQMHAGPSVENSTTALSGVLRLASLSYEGEEEEPSTMTSFSWASSSSSELPPHTQQQSFGVKDTVTKSIFRGPPTTRNERRQESDSDLEGYFSEASTTNRRCSLERDDDSKRWNGRTDDDEYDARSMPPSKRNSQQTGSNNATNSASYNPPSKKSCRMWIKMASPIRSSQSTTHLTAEFIANDAMTQSIFRPATLEETREEVDDQRDVASGEKVQMASPVRSSSIKMLTAELSMGLSMLPGKCGDQLLEWDDALESDEVREMRDESAHAE